MDQRQAGDPSGSYDVDEVTLRIGNVPIMKGTAATGRFVRVGERGSPYRLARRVIITLSQASPLNDLLRSWRDGGEILSLRMDRNADGATFSGRQAFVDEHSPRMVGHGDREWILIGGLEP